MSADHQFLRVSKSPAAIDPARFRRDEAVKDILAQLRLVVRTRDYPMGMAHVVKAIRENAQLKDGARLARRQKGQLISALDEAYRAIFPLMEDEASRRELTVSMNALGTLVLVWTGREKLWRAGSSAAQLADDFALAFHFSLLAVIVLDGIVARQRLRDQVRKEAFEAMLIVPPASDDPLPSGENP